MHSHSQTKFLKETLHFSGCWPFLKKWNNESVVSNKCCSPYRVILFSTPPPPSIEGYPPQMKEKEGGGWFTTKLLSCSVRNIMETLSMHLSKFCKSERNEKNYKFYLRHKDLKKYFKRIIKKKNIWICRQLKYQLWIRIEIFISLEIILPLMPLMFDSITFHSNPYFGCSITFVYLS